MTDLFIVLFQMRGGHWDETRDALLEIADEAFFHNVNEIDLAFFNNQAVYRGVKVNSRCDYDVAVANELW